MISASPTHQLRRRFISHARILAVLFSTTALAHADVSATEPRLDWTFQPLLVVSLAAALIVYIVGALRARAESRSGFLISQIFAFALGWLTLFAALISPIHEIGETLFSAHMLQHELLMVIAAPLLIVARPDLALLWALPFQSRRWIGRFQRTRWLHSCWRGLTTPLTAWLVHAIALWTWHIPSLFDATITSDWIHALQHSSFFGTALLFWGTLLYSHMGRRAYGKGILYVFTTAVHTSILGALLTFAASPWYSIYSSSTAAWGLTPLEDQQLGGLIMWIPAGIIYIIVGLWLLAGWIQDSDRRSSFSSAAARI